jgi:hypothetical protein
MAIPDFIQEALDRAPLVDESEIDPEEIAEMERIEADIRAGRTKLLTHEEIQRTIAAMKPLAG